MAKQIEAERDRAYHGFVELITRAKTAGRLREHFVPEDLVLLMANAGVVAATAEAAPRHSAAWSPTCSRRSAPPKQAHCRPHRRPARCTGRCSACTAPTQDHTPTTRRQPVMD